MPVYVFALVFFYICKSPERCRPAYHISHYAKIDLNLRLMTSFITLRTLLEFCLQVIINEVKDWCLLNENREESFFLEDCFDVGFSFYADEVILCVLIILHMPPKFLHLPKVYFWISSEQTSAWFTFQWSYQAKREIFITLQSLLFR